MVSLCRLILAMVLAVVMVNICDAYTGGERLFWARDQRELQSLDKTRALGLNSDRNWQFKGGHIVPTTTNTLDLGTSAVKFRNLYLAGTITSGGVTTTYQPSADNTDDLGTNSTGRWKDIFFAGNAKGGTFNKVTITAPASGSTLTIANGKTVTASNTLTFAGTDSTVMTFPAVSDTVVGQTSLKADGVRHVRVSLTTGNITGMYATPVEIIAAPGANKAIVLQSYSVTKLLNTTAFANGGAAQLQYGTTNHAGGQAIGATIAATFVNNAASVFAFRGGADLTSVALTAVANTSVTISNATGAFDTGDGSAFVDVFYTVVDTI